MAWPLDANDVVYSGEQIVPDTNLNEIQERIVDIHRERSQTFWPTVCEMPLSVPSWTPQGGTTPEWGCITAGETLWIPVSLPPGSVIKQVVVKVYLAAATGLFVRLDKVQANFASGTTAPAFTNVEAPASPTGTGAWNVVDMPTLSHTVAFGEIYLVRVGDPDAGDMCAGALVVFEPFTPT